MVNMVRCRPFSWEVTLGLTITEGQLVKGQLCIDTTATVAMLRLNPPTHLHSDLQGTQLESI